MTKRTIHTIVFLIVAAIIIIILTETLRNPSAAKPVRTIPQGTETVNPVLSATSTVSNVTTTPASSVKTYTLADVAKHNTQTDCWTAVRGTVYDLTPFVTKHPGGIPNISKVCGVDGTATFEGQHDGQARPETQLASLKIGMLAK